MSAAINILHSLYFFYCSYPISPTPPLLPPLPPSSSLPTNTTTTTNHHHHHNYSTIDKSDTRNGNYLGMRSRSGNRLKNPSLKLSTDSFILAATPTTTATLYLNPLNHNINSKENNQKNGKTDGKLANIAAIVEVCIEKPGGKLAPPIANPFKSKEVKDMDQPYLCNLCVSPRYRRKGLGKLVCELAEELVQIHWKKDMMYLHVEQNNIPAQNLYLNMGYELVTPGLSMWEKKLEGIENILYYSNSLSRKWDKKNEKFENKEKFEEINVDSGQRQKAVNRNSNLNIDIDADSILLGINKIDLTVGSNIMRSTL